MAKTTTARGSDTRTRLVRGGVTLLADGGWGQVTARAVAEQADANVGLIHYYFGGMPGLRAAIATAVVEDLVGGLQTALLEAADVDALLDALRRRLTQPADATRSAILTAALVEGAAREPELGEALRDVVSQARTELAGWLAEQHPDWTRTRTTGIAALVVAAVDGLLLHTTFDPDLLVDSILDALRHLLATPAPNAEELAP